MSAAVVAATFSLLTSMKWHSKCSVPRSPLTVTFIFHAGWSETQCVSGLNPSDFNHLPRICRVPADVFPRKLKVACGAHRLMNWAMSFLDMDSWKFSSISRIADLSASCVSSVAEDSLDPPKAESARTESARTSAMIAPPNTSVRMTPSSPFLGVPCRERRDDHHMPLRSRLPCWHPYVQ